MPDEVLVAGAGLGDVVLGVGVGLDPVGVGVGDWLGGAGSRSGSHCWAVPLVTAAVSDRAAEAVLLRLGSADSIAVANPVTAAASTPPVTKLAVTGRTCAKRMKALPVLLVTSAGTILQYGVATSGVARLTRAIRTPLHTRHGA